MPTPEMWIVVQDHIQQRVMDLQVTVDPLRPMRVAELSADHISGGEFRQGSRLIRWRTDKSPEDCKMDQMIANVKRSTDGMTYP